MTAFLLDRYRYVLEQRGFDVRNVRAVLQESGFAQLEPCRRAEAAGGAAGVHGVTGFPEAGGGVQARQEHRARAAGRRLDAAEHDEPPLAQLLKEPAEIALLQELEQRGPVIDSVLKSGENLRRAFVEAAQFGPAVDRFFTEIFVMVDDPALRKARLRLMKRLEQHILRIAEFPKSFRRRSKQSNGEESTEVPEEETDRRPKPRRWRSSPSRASTSTTSATARPTAIGR